MNIAPRFAPVVATAIVGMVASSFAVAQPQPTFLMAKPERTIVAPEQARDVIVIKFAHESNVRLRDGRLQSVAAVQDDVDLVMQYVDGVGGATERLFQVEEQWLDDFRQAGEQRSGKTLHDLNLFYRVTFDGPTNVGQICDDLNVFDVVEIAYVGARPVDPSQPMAAPPSISVDLAPPPTLNGETPDFQNLQGYREAAPLGVDADYGNTFSGGRGIGSELCDVETGWTDDHEDIINKALDRFVGLMPPPYPWDHGTAVLGELVGEDNGFGMLGICHETEIWMSSHLGFDIENAIVFAIAAVDPGDSVLIEVQCYQGPPSPHPCEYDPGIFAAVEGATANGIHVYAAAGNGNQNLDSSAYGGAFDRNVRDSGSVICGASNGSTLDKADFSNYGSRVDAHGWGYNVPTLAYGDLFGFPTVTEEYTGTFSGTSSASPIVTGAGIILNAIHRESFGFDMDPFDLRQLLADTGTPQGNGGIIGPRPDVRAAVRALGIPEIAVTGNLVPGGEAVVTSYGESGDAYRVYYSSTLASTPIHTPPYGYVYLGGNATLAARGTIGANGTATNTISIPINASGTYYVQGLQFFNNKPGTGSVSNFVQVDIP